MIRKLDAYRARMSTRRAERREADRDQGMAMVFCMVFIILGMLIVTPLLDYATTVLHSNRIQTDKTARAEAVRGALRIALADPKALYTTCGASGLNLSKPVGSPGVIFGTSTPALSIGVQVGCTTLSAANALSPAELRTAITTTQVGSAAPTGATGSVAGASGNADTSLWYSNGNATTDSQGNKTWLPYLPSHALSHPANGYTMPAWAGTCRVFFPGTYNAPVTITDSMPTYFASGIYYFESTVTFSGTANVVVGGGATPGCTDDQDAAYNAINAPLNHNITGLGATFIFGAAGRLVINDTGSTGVGPTVIFNNRLVAPTDVSSLPSKSVSIETVNGVLGGSGNTTGELDLSNQLRVPAPLVGDTPPTDPAASGYLPSTLIPVLAPGAQSNAIVDISFTTALASKVVIPGYLAVPQGRVNIAATTGSGANKDVEIVGGVLAALFTQTPDQPSTLQIGLVNPVVQKTFKLVAVTTSGMPSVNSVAIVQINDYGEYAINSWVTNSAGSTPT
jgi:hypothetical protein